jgi:hypothetical protein
MSRKFAGTLFLALSLAKDNRRDFINAWHDDDTRDAVKQARADIKAFEEIQVQLFGSTETALDAKSIKSRTVTLTQLRRMMDKNPDLSIDFDDHT